MNLDITTDISDLDIDNIQLKNTSRHDVGLLPDDYYKQKLSYQIYKFRSYLLPLINYELSLLKYIQSFHTPFLTWFFILSANFGSHTFYVLMLPLPVWIGSIHLTRDLVIVLGLGIYFTGFIKDLLCLPRPKSPPLKRLTMSHYTSQEYGCPSSHSANAIAVSLVLSLHIYHSSLSSYGKIILYFLLICYFLTMLIGRLYCGMHGLVDVIIGSLIGAIIFILRYLTINYHDILILNNNSFWVPIIFITIYYSLIYFHPTPIDPCPCFEDSIAFIAVLMGLNLGFWSITYLNGPVISSSYDKLPFTNNSPFSNLSKLGYIYNNHYAKIELTSDPFKIFARILIGVISVLIWKSLSKPLFTLIINLIRKHIFNDKSNNKSNVFAFMNRNDTRILVKYIVYAGISIVSIYLKYLFDLLNL